MTTGSIAGYLMDHSARLNARVDPVLVIALNLPFPVVVVLAYIWIGLNDVAADATDAGRAGFRAGLIRQFPFLANTPAEDL